MLEVPTARDTPANLPQPGVLKRGAISHPSPPTTLPHLIPTYTLLACKNPNRELCICLTISTDSRHINSALLDCDSKLEPGTSYHNAERDFLSAGAAFPITRLIHSKNRSKFSSNKAKLT